MVKRNLKIYALMMISFVGLLFLTNLVPVALVEKNIGESVQCFLQEGVYPAYSAENTEYLGQDNYTDAIMLNVISNLDSDKSYKDIFDMKYTVANDTDFNAIDDLYYMYNSTNNSMYKQSISYARYWHGYVVYLKPLLAFFNYSQIRKIMFCALYVMIGVLLVRLAIRLNLKCSICFAAGLIAVNVNRIWISIQYMNTFGVVLLSMIVITYLNKDVFLKRYNEINYVLGGIICFVDLLTTPIITYGCCAIYLVMYGLYVEEFGVKQMIKKLFCGLISWGVGYSMCWGSKWIIASIVLKKNVLADAMNSAQIRTESIPDGFTKMDWIVYTFKSNVGYLVEGENKLPILIVIICLVIWLAIFYHKKFKIEKFKQLLPLVFIALLPYLWYLIMQNHSGIHSFFTYRNQILTVVSISVIMIELIDFKRLTRQIRSHT